MTKIEVTISSIKCSLECSDEEADIFKKLANVLNRKTNELMLNTGKISDRLLLFTIILIDANKELKLFNDFENNIIKLIKNVAPLFNNTSGNLDNDLVLAGMVEENETENLPEDNLNQVTNEKILQEIEKNKKSNKEMIEFISKLINLIEKLENNINRM